MAPAWGPWVCPWLLSHNKVPKTIAALASANDLNALTNSLSNLKLPAEKVRQFSKWSGMEVNAKKCAASAILHAQASAGLVKCPDEDAAIRPRLEGHIHLGRGTVPYLPPDNPYNYLGVLLTLTLNWSHQFRATMTTAVEQACKFQSLFARTKVRSTAAKLWQPCAMFSPPRLSHHWTSRGWMLL